MCAQRHSPSPTKQLRRLRRRLRRLDPSDAGYAAARSRLLRDIALAKHQLPRSKASPTGRRSPRKPPAKRPSLPAPAIPKGPHPQPVPRPNLGRIFSAKNLQESIKTVTNLRSTVKNWLQYLQQADQLLDTLYITSNSLKETGVLDKLVRSKGKDLTTEDFTNILLALMNTPLGSQLFKAGGGEQQSGSTA